MGRQTKSFRQTHSERSATNSYRAFGKYRNKQILSTKSKILNKSK